MPSRRFGKGWRDDKRPPASRPSGPARAPATVRVREVGAGEWELVHPRCALERADDLEEVRGMVEAGEAEIAIDELRWLLGGCHDFIDAHRLLGELALADADLNLARGHFGVAFQLGLKAAKNLRGTLSYRFGPNQSFHEAGKGLVWTLLELGKRELAVEAADQLTRLDPTDPLEVRALLDGPADGLPIITL